MTRTDGWEINLQEFFLSRLHTPFTWSTNDCCSFSADSVKAITDVDVAEWFRGKMEPEEGRRASFKLLKEFAGGSIKETWEKIAHDNELEEIQVDDIKAGDLVMMKIPPLDPIAGLMSNDLTIGVKSFKEGYFSPGKDGVVLSIEPEIIKAGKI